MRKQFTIVELLMAVALTVVIGLIINMAFYNTQLASQRATASLEFQAKGRTIMDLLTQDISNAYTNDSGNCKPTYLTSATSTYLIFKTALPQKNVRYLADPGYSDATSNYYYLMNFANIGWYYTATTSSTTTPVHTYLYRRISKPADTRDTTNTASKKAQTFLQSDTTYPDGISKYSTSSTTADTYIGNGDLLATDEIRAFNIDSLSNGGNVTAVIVRFSLTNAPYSARNGSNYDVFSTKAPDGDTITYAPDGSNSSAILKAKATALAAGYIWVDFVRIIPIMPFVP